jgi:hypothetical protein
MVCVLVLGLVSVHADADACGHHFDPCELYSVWCVWSITFWVWGLCLCMLTLMLVGGQISCSPFSMREAALSQCYVCLRRHLSENQITELPSGVFQGLTSLRSL